MRLRSFTILMVLLTCGRLAFAQEAVRPAEAIQDNSFLVEEAYNQEPGVVQHILTIQYARSGGDEREWEFAFTQEWPFFSQTHQLSYTVPLSVLDDGTRTSSGIGDVFLNYRFQALMENGSTPAFAPRLSLILPTSDETDELGYQVNLPVSKVVSDRWSLHGNAGATLQPGVAGRDLVGYHLGASAIYAVTPELNLMLEAVANWDEEVDDFGRTELETAVVISPGFRYAFNHSGDAQTVIGLAAPIGVTSAAADFSVFVYASFEHFFFRPRGGK